MENRILGSIDRSKINNKSTERKESTIMKFKKIPNNKMKKLAISNLDNNIDKEEITTMASNKSIDLSQEMMKV